MRTLKGQITPKKVNGQYTSKKRWKDNAQAERAGHNFKDRWKDNAHTERAIHTQKEDERTTHTWEKVRRWKGAQAERTKHNLKKLKGQCEHWKDNSHPKGRWKDNTHLRKGVRKTLRQKGQITPSKRWKDNTQLWKSEKVKRSKSAQVERTKHT